MITYTFSKVNVEWHFRVKNNKILAWSTDKSQFAKSKVMMYELDRSKYPYFNKVLMMMKKKKGISYSCFVAVIPSFQGMSTHEVKTWHHMTWDYF